MNPNETIQEAIDLLAEDGEGFPACDREDDLQDEDEDETIETKEDDNGAE